jgi:hypothetical protein
MVRVNPISILAVLLFTGNSIMAQPSVEIDWRAEIDLLGKELVQRHPNLFFSTDSASFFSALDRVASETEGQTVFQVSVRLQQVLAGLGDPHTLINYHFNIDQQLILPIECYWFEDGLYILRSRMEYQELIGKKITSINGIPLERVIDSLSTLIPGTNASLVKASIPRMITWTQLLQTFGFSGSTRIQMGVEDADGQMIQSLIELPARESELGSVQPDSLPLGWQDRKAYFRERYFPAEKIYYIQYNKCWSRETEVEFGSGASALFMPSFREFEKLVFHTLRKQEVDKLVFDLRFNNGGNSTQGTRFIERLRKTRFGEHGKVYLIVGRETSSEAIINAVDLMKRFDVVVVGENSGGKPNDYGDVRRFVLPRSNLVVNNPTRYYALVEGDPQSIIPDIPAPESFSTYMAGIDPAFEAIRKHSSE